MEEAAAVARCRAALSSGLTPSPDSEQNGSDGSTAPVDGPCYGLAPDSKAKTSELGAHGRGGGCAPAEEQGEEAQEETQSTLQIKVGNWGKAATAMLRPAPARPAGKLGELELCSELHRAACFARGVPDSLPLGGSRIELAPYTALLKQARLTAGHSGAPF